MSPLSPREDKIWKNKVLEPGQLERFDYQYERNETANLFMLANPIEGWRTVEVTKQRTAIDYAHILKKLVDDCYPEALMIKVVQDNLNTHTLASLHKAFEPAEARRIINRLGSVAKSWNKRRIIKVSPKSI